MMWITCVRRKKLPFVDSVVSFSPCKHYSARARTYLEGRLESEGLVLAVMLMAVSVGR